MHKNYYLFKAQTEWLNTKIKDFIIEDCFTYQKSELILKISNSEELFLRISINPANPYIYITESINVKKSKVHLFNELISNKIKQVTINSYDKIGNIITNDYRISSIFYGRNQNIILYNIAENEISTFKKDNSQFLSQDFKKKLSPGSLKINQLINIVQSGKDTNIIKLLSHSIIGFNYTLSRECCFRSQLDFNTDAKMLSENQLTTLCKCINDLYFELAKPSPIIYYDNNIPKHLVIVELEHLKHNHESRSFKSVNEAWRTFTWQIQKHQVLENILNKSFSALNKRIEFLKKTINKIEEFEKLEERKKLSELKGNLLLTFISQIPRGTKSVVLMNIFSEKQEKIEIKLNPAKSTQDNAQKYFEKFKDIDIQKERITNRKKVLDDELKSLTTISKKYINSHSVKEAHQLQEKMIQRNLLQSSKSAFLKQEIPEHKFRKIMLAGKWQIFIGKNNVNNDLLTFGFAHKYDWWFHAQNVSGAHTIIHLNNKTEIPPTEIINDVASLAAFHSSAKHSGVVPVIYTQVRYIRRIKKAPPGTVSVLQHKTIFVEPKNL